MSDIGDEEWEATRQYLEPVVNAVGRPRETLLVLRVVINGDGSEEIDCEFLGDLTPLHRTQLLELAAESIANFASDPRRK